MESTVIISTQHQLARECSNLLLDSTDNIKTYLIERLRKSGVQILSLSSNSVLCRFQGRKYSFHYNSSFGKVIHAKEYFSQKHHYFIYVRAINATNYISDMRFKWKLQQRLKQKTGRN